MAERGTVDQQSQKVSVVVDKGIAFFSDGMATQSTMEGECT
jgi:hypothetical protein